MKPTRFRPRRPPRSLLRESRSGALATLMPGSGDPYCSLVNVATAADGSPLLLISRLAVHTKNILRRCARVADARRAPEGDPLQGARVMLSGNGGSLTDDPAARRRYLAASPKRRCTPALPTSRFYAIDVSGAHLVAGFGRIVDLAPADVLHRSVAAPERWSRPKPEVVAHMNADHAEACGSMRPSCSARRTATGAAPAAIRKGSTCRTAARRCGCRFRSGSTAPACCAQVLKQLADRARASR